MPKTDCTDILKAFADHSRVRIIKALLAKPHSVNDLPETVGLSQYNVSKHLRILRQASLVDVQAEVAVVASRDREPLYDLPSMDSAEVESPTCPGQ